MMRLGSSRMGDRSGLWRVGVWGLLSSEEKEVPKILHLMEERGRDFNPSPREDETG